MRLIDHVNGPSVAAYASGSGTALVGFFSMEHIALCIGMVTALVTCSVNVYAGMKRARREEAKALLDAQVAAAQIAGAKSHIQATP